MSILSIFIRVHSIKFRENPSSESRADTFGQTRRQTDMSKGNWNAPKKKAKCVTFARKHRPMHAFSPYSPISFPPPPTPTPTILFYSGFDFPCGQFNPIEFKVIYACGRSKNALGFAAP
jgi:hypothetical protein